MIVFDGVHNKYRLTNEAADAYKKILTSRATATDLGSTAPGQ
ncbi:MAG TPA: hypothetical protein O0X38_05235 [Methanocorpusculum sp.]|nr:hypothetical protein [Methanocorpusculum sp.]